MGRPSLKRPTCSDPWAPHLTIMAMTWTPPQVTQGSWIGSIDEVCMALRCAPLASLQALVLVGAAVLCTRQSCPAPQLTKLVHACQRPFQQQAPAMYRVLASMVEQLW